MTLHAFLAELIPVATGALLAGIAGATVAVYDARQARARQKDERQGVENAERQRERRRIDEEAAESAAIALLSLRLASPEQIRHMTAGTAGDFVDRTWSSNEDARRGLARVMTRHYDDEIAALAEAAFGDVTNAGNAVRACALEVARRVPVVDVGEAQQLYDEADATLSRYQSVVRSRLGRSLTPAMTHRDVRRSEVGE